MANTGNGKHQELLVEAAQAFEAELRRFEELSESIRKEPLNSQKSLGRMESSLEKVAEFEARLGGAARNLVEVIGAARAKQEAQAKVIATRVAEFEERAGVFRELLGRHAGLGEIATKISAAVVQLSSNSAAQKAEVMAALPELIASVGKAAESASSLAASAHEKGFADLARTVESLRQQTLAAQNKLLLLHKKLLPPAD